MNIIYEKDYFTLHHHSHIFLHLLEISVEMCEKLNEEDGNTRLVLVDCDDDGENLSTKVKISTDIDDEDVADYLSDTYGFCVNYWYEINE